MPEHVCSCVIFKPQTFYKTNDKDATDGDNNNLLSEVISDDKSEMSAMSNQTYISDTDPEPDFQIANNVLPIVSNSSVILFFCDLAKCYIAKFLAKRLKLVIQNILHTTQWLF